MSLSRRRKLATDDSKQYRGGLPIIEVRESSPDRQKGLRKGDILVGLDKWETTSIDNVLWILNEVEKNRPSNRADPGLKFYVTREGDEVRIH